MRAEVFELHRPRLFGIACRMLGSRSEAEDVLQDAYLRWHESKPANIQSVVAFLVTITTRLCLERLRKRKQERGRDVAEAWLSKLLVADCVPSPEVHRERSEEVSMALSVVLNCLGREESSAFLLHDVFDYDYPEMVRMLGKAEPSCRQIVHRARKRLREYEPRSTVRAEAHERMQGELLSAIESGDRKAALSLIEAEVKLVA